MSSENRWNKRTQSATNFLIMQGKITKVLNMKPIEILSMIEEAAGTKTYDMKKANALSTIDKKNSKLTEIEHIFLWKYYND